VIAFTTGRQTNQRLNTLLKELVHSLPNARAVRRGKSNLEGLGWRLFEEGFEYATILKRWHGGPGRVDFFKVEAQGLTVLAPSLLLKTVNSRENTPIRENTPPKQSPTIQNCQVRRNDSSVTFRRF